MGKRRRNTGKYKRKENITEKLKPRICTNCGAPLKGLKCEYCGTEYDGFIDAENLKQKIEIENKIIDNQSRMNELRLKIAQNQQAAILQQILGYGISYNTVIRASEDFWGNET